MIRFDPSQGQTSVMSVPRDLMVNITAPDGSVYTGEKINAAYTIGSKLSGTRGGMLLAAETLKREVFPGLTLNAIVDVNFKGFDAKGEVCGTAPLCALARRNVSAQASGMSSRWNSRSARRNGCADR